MTFKMTHLDFTQVYPFVCEATDESDFENRMVTVSVVVINEMNERLDRSGICSPFKLVEIIDQFNAEVNVIVENINKTEIVDNQKGIDKDYVLRLIEEFSDFTWQKYCYAKLYYLN